MKLRIRGQSDGSAPITDSSSTARAAISRRRRAIIVALAVLVAFATVGWVARHAILSVLIPRLASFYSGDRVTIGTFAIGSERSIWRDVHVQTPAGEPLFDARAITVDLSLQRLILGRALQPALRGVRLDRPVFSLVRSRAGGYNISSATARTSGGANRGAAAPPWRLSFKISAGEIRLIDRAPVSSELGLQRLTDIEVNGRIDSSRRSRASGAARFVSKERAQGILRSWPLVLKGTLDVPRGLAIARVTAARFPLRGPLGFLVHGTAFRVDDGLLQNLALQLYAVRTPTGGWNPTALGGSAAVLDGRLAIGALRRPVTGLRGPLTLTADGIWSSRLDAQLAGVALVARGGAFDREHPTLRIGISADGDLHDLRQIFAFSAAQPVRGRAHIETLLEAPIPKLLVRTSVRVDRGFYRAVPLRDLAGRVDYHAGAVVLDGLRAQYGAASVAVGGRFLIGGRSANSAIVATGQSAGAAIPYGENLVPRSTVDLVTLIRGSSAGYRARGTVAVRGNGTSGGGMFAVNERGVGEFGPFRLLRTDGSSLAGALRLERPTSRSAAWLSAVRYRVAVPAHPAQFEGLSVPAFPPLAGVLDGEAAGGGTPGAFALTGAVSGTDLRAGQIVLGTGRSAIGGTLSDVRLGRLSIDGPLGAFIGSAAVQGGSFALHGAYTGSLDRLVPLTGPQDARGAVRGGVLATVKGPDVVVQSRNVISHGASLRGVAFETAAGTLAVHRSTVHLIAASASLLGARVVAAESGAGVAISAPNISAAALRATGLPLEAGRVSAYGTAAVGAGPLRFAGTVAVAAGQARGYAVAGDARLTVDGPDVHVSGGTGALGSTFGDLAGTLRGVGTPRLSYALDARVPLGDIGGLGAALRLPVRHLAGSYAANLHVGGAGNSPELTGRIDVPEGNFNGLAFRAAAARIEVAPNRLAARDGRVTVGSTTAALAASVDAGAYVVRADAAAVNLADFNDYFDSADTLGGRGSLGFDLSLRPAGLKTDGRIALRGPRFRGFRFDAATAAWGTHDGQIAGQAELTSRAGTLALRAQVTPHKAADPRRALQAADFTARASFGKVDLGTWLIAAGSSLPVQGTGDATLSLRGRFAQPAIGIDAHLAQATIAGVDIRSAHLRANTHGSRIRVTESDADVGFGSLAGEGLLGLRAADPLAFDLRFHTTDIGPALRRFAPAARGRTVAGEFDADVRVGGTRSRPTAAGGFDLERATYAGFTVPRAIGELALAGKSVELRAAEVAFAHGQAFIAGSLPLRLRPLRVGPPGAPVSVDVTAQTIDLAQFGPLLPAGTSLGGTLDGRFGIQGTVDRPQLFGSLAVAGGAYRSPFERAAISNVGARLAFSGTSVELAAFHADVGRGTLDGNGRIILPSPAQPQAQYDAHLAAKAATFDLPAFGRGTIDGTLELAGSGRAPLLSGAISLANAVIPVSAVYGAGFASATAGSAGFPIDPRLEIHAAARDNVRVRSGIIDIGVTGAVDLAGSLAAPQLAGGFAATDGTISSYNHVFRIVNAAVTFDPVDGAVPSIEARAVSRVRNPDPDPSRNIAGAANIYVTVSGTADGNNLQVTYSSDPAYSQEQIVGLLLDVPALLGAVNFNLNGAPGSPVLRGAPGETNVLLPPGVSPEQVSPISFNEEVFSLLNGQFTQRALGPAERTFQRVLGLSDVEFTVDYGGGLGYSLRRQIGKRDFSAFLSQTVSYPERINVGFDLAPKPYERVNFSFYAQNGVTSLITNQTPGEEFFGSGRRLTTVQPLGNRAGVSLNFNRRF